MAMGGESQPGIVNCDVQKQEETYKGHKEKKETTQGKENENEKCEEMRVLNEVIVRDYIIRSSSNDTHTYIIRQRLFVVIICTYIGTHNSSKS